MINLKTKVMVAAGTAFPLFAMASPAFAVEGAAGTNPVIAPIQSAITSVTTDAAPVIAGAVGLGVIFWGAKILWTKFKSMT